MTGFPHQPSVSDRPDLSSGPLKQATDSVCRSGILIVDDDDLVRDSLSIFLSKQGYPTEVAANGFEALELLDGRPFGIIICDMLMPGLGGLQLVEALRQTGRHEINRRTPVIFMTGKNGICPYGQKAKDLIIAGCLYKPLDDLQILPLITGHLGPADDA